MEGLERFRKATRQHIARMLGTREETPMYLAGQTRTRLEHSSIVGLPQIIVPTIQNQDSASTAVGTFNYMVGYDPLGSAPLGG